MNSEYISIYIYCFEAIQEISGIPNAMGSAQDYLSMIARGHKGHKDLQTIICEVALLKEEYIKDKTHESLRVSESMKCMGTCKAENCLLIKASQRRRRCFWVECSLRQVASQVLPG